MGGCWPSSRPPCLIHGLNCVILSERWYIQSPSCKRHVKHTPSSFWQMRCYLNTSALSIYTNTLLNTFLPGGLTMLYTHTDSVDPAPSSLPLFSCWRYVEFSKCKSLKGRNARDVYTSQGLLMVCNVNLRWQKQFASSLFLTGKWVINYRLFNFYSKIIKFNIACYICTEGTTTTRKWTWTLMCLFWFIIPFYDSWWMLP